MKPQSDTITPNRPESRPQPSGESSHRSPAGSPPSRKGSDNADDALFQLALTDSLTERLYGSASTAAIAEHWHLLRQSEPLVSLASIAALQDELTASYESGGQIIQTGDCVEVLAECYPEHFQRRLAFLSSIRNYMQFRLRAPVVAIGRIAGQFAKPRSQFFESGAGFTEANATPVHSFMGEMINGPEQDPWSRTPDIKRLLWAQNAARLGVAALEQHAATKQRIYCSHEALSLVYDGAQTISHGSAGTFNRSCHLPWIGMRTTFEGSRHIAYLSFVDNPVGVKIGPATTPETLASVITAANPRNIAGKLVLITRFGSGQAANCLPPLIAKAKELGAKVLWLIDPMHGNTHKNAHGLKVRSLADIAAEISETVAVHRELGSRPHGLHLESSPDEIRECSTTRECGDDIEPGSQYQTLCDPRLDYQQVIATVHHYLKELADHGLCER